MKIIVSTPGYPEIESVHDPVLDACGNHHPECAEPTFVWFIFDAPTIGVYIAPRCFNHANETRRTLDFDDVRYVVSYAKENK